LGRSARDSEIAASVGFTPSDVRELREQAATTHVSIDTAVGDGPVLELKARDSLAPDLTVQRKEQSQLVIDALPLLSEREQFVLRRLYVDGKGQAEVAKELGVSDARISQIHAAAIDRLRKKVAAA
jgi:RNA polymerase sigma factor for flagellar operon FliA